MKKYIGGFEDEPDIKEHSKMIHTCLFKTILVGHYNHLEKLSQNKEYQILSLSLTNCEFLLVEFRDCYFVEASQVILVSHYGYDPLR